MGAKDRRRQHRNADIERKRRQHHAGQKSRIDRHHADEDEREEKVDDECQSRARDEIADIFKLPDPRD